MKKLNFIFVFILVANVVLGQGKENIVIFFADNAPTIDGYDEIAWDIAPAIPIENAHQAEQPTVTAYWKAIWDYSALYILVSVEDDDHWPSWESGGSWFDYDQVEVYFDVNDVLEDGMGVGDPGTGHYQCVGKFTQTGSGVLQDIELDGRRPKGQFCYVLDGEDYLYEYKLDYTSFINKDGLAMTAGTFEAMDSIGFDVTIIDQDEGVTSARQRATWHNTGEINENYAVMDDAGTITMGYLEPSSNVETKIHTFSVYPNPVSDYLTINAEFDILIISNILGEEIETIVNSDNRISMKSLARGIYIIQAFNKGNLLGVVKIHKM